jgi:hypothetical protein
VVEMTAQNFFQKRLNGTEFQVSKHTEGCGEERSDSPPGSSARMLVLDQHQHRC